MRDSLLVIALIGVLSPVSPAGSAAPARGPEALVDGFVRAWNTHDTKLFAELFARDADWVAVGGVRVKTRTEIQAFLEREHATWAKTTTISATKTDVRLPRRDVAVIYFHWEVLGAVGREGKPANASRGITLLVAVNDPAEGWRIVAGQASRHPPAQ